MENNIWQSLVKKWSALTGKTPLPAQIASLLSLALVSVFVVFIVLWVAKLSGVSESFLRLLEILLSPTVIICALVLYLWRRHDEQIRNILRWITKQSLGQSFTTKPDNPWRRHDAYIDDILGRIPTLQSPSRSKPDSKSEASLSDTATSSSSPNISEIEKKAKQGDAKAQFNLGVLYRNGKGVEQNHAEAAKWYLLAAKQGHAKARVNLGILYRKGEGVEQNHAEAVKWYLLAAEQGDAKAQFNLGVLYRNGEGVEQNHAEAVKWYLLAAKQGHAKARVNLGILYRKGEGVEQNHAEAAKWYLLAAEQGDAKAQFNLGVLYVNGEGVAQNYSEAYIWFSLASVGNHPNARKARDQVAQKLDAETMKNAQAEATRREEKIRRKREGESQ